MSIYQLSTEEARAARQALGAALAGETDGMSRAAAERALEALGEPLPLRRLVADLTHAVNSELNAAGRDEVRQHPILMSKARIAARAERMLWRLRK